MSLADMEIDSPPFADSTAASVANDSPSSPSIMTELIGSPLYNASMKLRKSRSSILGHQRSTSSLKRQAHTLSVLDPTEDKENDTSSTQGSVFGKLPAITTITSTPAFRKHVRRRSGTNYRPAFTHQHFHHHSRSSSTVSSNGSIFKICPRPPTTSASSRGLQEALDLFGDVAADTMNTPDIGKPFVSRRRNSFQTGKKQLQQQQQLQQPQQDIQKPDFFSRFPLNCSTPNLNTRPLDMIDLDDAYDAMDYEENASEDDNAEFAEVYGSPLQQRQHAKSRLELNNHIKRNLQRATSLINYSISSSQQHGYHHSGDFDSNELGGPIEESESESEVAALPSAMSASTSDLIHRPRLTRSTTSLAPAPELKSAGFDSSVKQGNSLLSKTSLKTFYIDGCTLPHIDTDQFHRLLVEYQQKRDGRDRLCGQFDELVVVDCRFEYEYQGGHIEGAINVSSKSELEEAFFPDKVINIPPLDFSNNSHSLLVFHCEFSSHRGPLMATNLRSWDRCLNRENYPNLYYPDIVILEGGYKKYYDRFIADNHIHSYVEMGDPQFKDECERGLDKLRRDNKLSLSRKSSISSSLNISLSRKSSYANFETPGSGSNTSTCSANSSCFSLSMSNMPLKRTTSSSTTMTSSSSSLDFGGSTKLDFGGKLKRGSSLFGDDQLTSPNSSAFGNGIFGGFGNRKVDLDSLYDQSPLPKQKLTQQRRTATDDGIFKQPMLPRRLPGPARHRRAETIGCFTYGQRKDRHDTPIGKRTGD
ncbi:DEKNAAC104362 [Brettanomyces naardenensis]|uniref:M-phase inducer phosphatase n=1 Tax=Brettanomyces naardenensis TaxID=13370 RepID=A0A448YQM5_BRENA|nr:DEKNAAC104362 [Brettanomyces naardenensis]